MNILENTLNSIKPVSEEEGKKAKLFGTALLIRRVLWGLLKR